MQTDDISIIATGNGDSILSSGMRFDEAATKAEIWWEKTGRVLMAHDLKQHQRINNRGEFASSDPDASNFLPSGIINGIKWADLTDREKVMITYQWHNNFVVIQNVKGMRKPQFKFGKGIVETDKNS